MAVISRDLGPVTAYAAAVNRGYTGTREEFETLMASYATVAQEAEESASAAADSASDAESSASAAVASANNASGSAGQAATSASNASDAAIAAQSAQEAAESARDVAQSAQTAAEAAQEGAETAVAGFDTIVIAAINDISAASTNQKELAKRQAQKSEAWAVGQHNGQDVGVSDPAYHNNAKYYAESVGTAATTATTKASEAAQSAENAAASASAAAQSAQSLVIDDTLSQAGQAADAKGVGDKIKESGNELFQISGYINQNYVKGRERYVDNGVEKFANHQKWISPKQGEYIELKRGDIISISENNRYHYRVCYSTDNKLTWIMSAEMYAKYTVENDAIAWIPIITTTVATDDDISHIADNHIIKIKRNGANMIGKNTAEINGVMDAIAIDPYANYVIEGIKSGSTYIYVNTTATENGGTDRIIEIPDINKGDAFRIKFNITPKYNLQNFDDFYFVIREIGEDDSSVLKTTVFKLSEKNVADYTVYYDDTAKIIANINLKRSNEAVSAGYYQEIDYSATVIRIKEQDDIYTEAGDTWEV